MMMMVLEGEGNGEQEDHQKQEQQRSSSAPPSASSHQDDDDQEEEEDGGGCGDDEQQQKQKQKQQQQQQQQQEPASIDDDGNDNVDHHENENDENDHSTSNTAYKYEERILISPRRRSSGSRSRQQQHQEQHYDVRLESYSSLLKLKNETSSSVISPFPDNIVNLLQQQPQHDVVKKIRIQVQNRATSKTGHNNALLHTVSPLGFEQGDDEEALLLSGPSGVYVSIEFIVSGGKVNDEANINKKYYYKNAFMKILKRMIGSDRILLASLSIIQEQRTRRYIDVVNVVKKRHDGGTVEVIEVSTILPLQGSSTPLAAEGLQAFLNLLPCSGGDSSSRKGVFGVADATAWSNLLLGIGLPSNKKGGGGRATSTKRHLEVISDDLRGLWFDFRRRSSDNSGNQQYYTISQGLYYSLMNTTESAASAASSADHDDDSRHSHTQHHKHHVIQDISLKDILPTTVGGDSTLSTCSFADTTSVKLVGLDGDDENESKEVLLQRKHKLSEPLFSFSSSSSATVAADPPPPPTTTWEVHMDVLRSSSNGRAAAGAGSSGGGKIISSLYNYHPECSAHVKFYQTIPLSIIEPVWQSFTIQSNNDNGSSILQLPRNDGNHYLRVKEETSDNNDPTTIQIEYEYDIQPSTSIHLSLDYQPSFLSFENFPADPNRGFEINPFKALFQLSPECAAAAASNAKSLQQSSPLWLYSNSVLMMIPVPDMSMPFNVLSLTCTVYAFVVGAMINLLIRRASERVKNTIHPPPVKKKLLVRIKEHIRTKLTKLLGSNKSSSAGGSGSSDNKKEEEDKGDEKAE